MSFEDHLPGGLQMALGALSLFGAVAGMERRLGVRRGGGRGPGAVLAVEAGTLAVLPEESPVRNVAAEPARSLFELLIT